MVIVLDYFEKAIIRLVSVKYFISNIQDPDPPVLWGSLDNSIPFQMLLTCSAQPPAHTSFFSFFLHWFYDSSTY